MKTTIVIPVKNESRHLDVLIESLLKQIGQEDEIFFIDAGSIDNTQQIIQSYAIKHPPIRLYVCPGAFPGKARNMAIRHTNADVIAQIDGGNIPGECWLEKLLEPIRDAKADYVTGDVDAMPINIRFLGIDLDLGAVYAATLFRVPRLGKSGGPPAAGGACAAYKREIWEKSGGFPEWLRFGSDPLYIKKVCQQPIKFAFVQEAVIYWQIGPRPLDVLRRHFRNQKNIFLSLGHMKKSSFKVLIRMLVCVFLVAGLWVPYLALLSMIMFAFMSFVQFKKSLKIYCSRNKHQISQMLVIGVLILGIDVVAMAAKIVGTLYYGAIFLFRWCRGEHQTQEKAYLSADA
ncbi:MAG: glycosyltransferase [Chlamydiota bacterium]|nr:glycosyltransferase [Chlamydiota bacterium]